MTLALPTLAVLSGCAPAPEDAGPDAPGGIAQQAAALRPDQAGNNALFRFEAGDAVEAFDSPGGEFRIHFTREGQHRVLPTDADADGVPDAVQTVAAGYDEVFAFYTETLGFRAPVEDGALAPNDGGDGRFDVYLVDFEHRGDGAFVREACLQGAPSRCMGYMAQENDFVGYGYPSLAAAVRILASHEFFHAVQAAYDADQGSVLSEATAVWATEKFDPDLDDFEAFSAGYLDNPDRPLDEPLPGPVDVFSYGMGLWFQFLDERFGESIILALWEAVEDGAGGEADPRWLPTLAQLLETTYEVSFADALTEFAAWNLYTGRRADPALAWARGEGYPTVAMTEVSLPFSDDRLRRFHASTAYYRAPLEGRTSITASVVGDEAERADLEVFVALRTGNAITWPQPVTAGPVPTSGADEVIVLIVNSAIEGQSRRPGLCIGEPHEELVACMRALINGPLPEEDMGVPEADAAVDETLDGQVDLGVAPDATLDTDGGDPGETTSGGDGGCQQSGRTPASLAGLLSLLGLGLRRRRRGTLA